MIQYQEKMSQKIRDEYNIKTKEKENTGTPGVPNVAALVYGERMFMSKYKNRPKFLEDLNSTLSPRKQDAVCLTCSSASSTKLLPQALVSKIKGS